MTTKTCSKCKSEKYIEKFRKWSWSKDGLHSECNDCYNEYRRNYYKNNIKHREKVKEDSKRQRRELKLEVLNHYSKGAMVCQCCKESAIEFLSIDHINGNGGEHRKIGLTSKKFYRWLKNNGYPEGYRVLCMNCNFSIGVNGYCPHQHTS